jgi:ribosome-associated translation inhibitor RaiA
VQAMAIKSAVQEVVEISPKFRQTVEERIARLERDADFDELQMNRLEDIDHIRRQMRLITAQRAEALRMRLFLDRAKTRLPRPLIGL